MKGIQQQRKKSGSNLKISEHWTVNYNLCEFKDTLLSLSTFRYCFVHTCNLSNAVSTNVRYLNTVLESLNCTDTNFTKSEFKNSTMSYLVMTTAKLDDVDVEYANFVNKNLKDCFNHTQSDDQSTFGTILKEPLIGYKKTREDVIITAEIPAGAIVFSINNHKCRANKAKIIDMNGHEILHSYYDYSFHYKLGQIIDVDNFNTAYNVECGAGFHFFKNKADAEAYHG